MPFVLLRFGPSNAPLSIEVIKCVQGKWNRDRIENRVANEGRYMRPNCISSCGVESCTDWRTPRETALKLDGAKVGEQNMLAFSGAYKNFEMTVKKLGKMVFFCIIHKV